MRARIRRNFDFLPYSLPCCLQCCLQARPPVTLIQRPNPVHEHQTASADPTTEAILRLGTLAARGSIDGPIPAPGHAAAGIAVPAALVGYGGSPRSAGATVTALAALVESS